MIARMLLKKLSIFFCAIWLFCGAIGILMADDSPIIDQSVNDRLPDQEAGDYDDYRVPVYDDSIVAIVNDKAITMHDLMQKVLPYVQQISQVSYSRDDFLQKLRKVQQQVLEAMIERILIVSDFEKKGGQISNSYVQREYESYLRSQFGNDRIGLSRYLKEHGQSIRAFKKEVRDNSIVGFVLGNLRRKEPEISPSKVKEYYDQHISEFRVGKQLYLKRIELDKSKYSESDLDDKVAKILEALSNDGNIDSVIKMFSDFYKRADIGWVVVDDLIPEYFEAVKNLSVGGFSTVFEVGDHACVLYVVDEKPAKTLSLDESRLDIERKLSDDYRAQVKKEFIDKLKKKAYIKVFLQL